MSILCWISTALIVGALISLATYIGTATAQRLHGDCTAAATDGGSPSTVGCCFTLSVQCLSCSMDTTSRSRTSRPARLQLARPQPTPFPPAHWSSALFVFRSVQAKYGAEWALVTGSSSGIGRALTSRLARQGISVVMVAIDDKLLTDVHAQMTKDYPNVQFRKIGVNLGKSGYMEPIIAGTKDILPTLIFNNAGYVQTGLFSDSTLESLLANYECNATAPIHVTHHFVGRILAESKRTVAQRRGGIFFTSSPAGIMPCPVSHTHDRS